jgi:hypothetical protein
VNNSTGFISFFFFQLLLYGNIIRYRFLSIFSRTFSKEKEFFFFLIPQGADNHTLKPGGEYFNKSRHSFRTITLLSPLLCLSPLDEESYTSKRNDKRKMPDYAGTTAASHGTDVTSLIQEFFSRLADYFIETFQNLGTAITTPKFKYWLRICVIVAAYIMVRPLIELFFKTLLHRKLDKEDAERKKQEEAFTVPGTQAKMSANALRTSKTDEEKKEEEETVKSTGVMEWGRDARKRQKKYLKNLEREAERKAEDIDDEELLELLDWSESDHDDEKKVQKDL